LRASDADAGGAQRLVWLPFGYPDLDEWLAVAREEREGHIYSRNSNPTVRVFEEKLRVLEGAGFALGFSSGMAAISSTVFALLRPGDRVVTFKDTYGGTTKFFTEFAPRYEIDVTFCDTTDHDSIEAEIAKGCRMVYLESPTNPTLKVVDLARLAAAAKAAGAISVVDNTFATPINQNPLELGIDLVIHSATKFLGGHADALGGVVCGNGELVKSLYHYREINGCILHPEAAYLLLRGMKTLHLRIARQNENAIGIAQFMREMPQIARVYYPGLPEHENHDIAARQMRGFGGVLSFMLEGGFDAVRRFLPRLRYAHLAANLGTVETVAGPPATTSHVECTPEEREAMGIPEGLVRYSCGMGIPEGLVRYSCGIEDLEDLITDLESALEGL